MGNIFVDTVQLYESIYSVFNTKIKNPIEYIKFSYKAIKSLIKLEDKFYHVIFDNLITFNLLYDFIIFIKDINPDTEYSDKYNAFGNLSEMSIVIKDKDTKESKFMITLYIRGNRGNEIHFSMIKHDKGKIMVYPTYLFIQGYVSHKTAIAEYDEEFNNMIKRFMYDSTIDVAKKGEPTNGKWKYLYRIFR